MEITERSLRALVAAADERHRAGMRAMPEAIRTLHQETRGHRVGAAAPTGDAALAAFAESVELAAVAAYGIAAKSGLVTTKAILDAAVAFSGHHQQHAAAFASAAGDAATGAANQKLLDALGPRLTAAKTELDVVQFAYDLEQAAAATYLYALGALESQAALELTAAILPVEAQHAVVLGSVLGDRATADDYLPAFETATAALDPMTYALG